MSETFKNENHKSSSSSFDEIRTYALIMAGGKGTRLWPESTSKKPKQYLRLTSDKSLLQESLLRLEGFIGPEHRFIVTTCDQRKLASEHSEGLINNEGLIFEPSSRDTAPCIFLSMASLEAKNASADSVVCVVPSDHIILNKQGFQQTLKTAVEHAYNSEDIVTIGITPHFPHTGYGYIEKTQDSHGRVLKVKSFKEKPDRETAEQYLCSGDYFWNSGMFIAKLSTLKTEFEQHVPQFSKHYDQLLSILKRSNQNEENVKQLHEVYAKLEKISFDYALMEKSSRINMVPSNFDWNDLGSWDALESSLGLNKKDENNTVVKAKEVHSINSKGNIIFAPDKYVALMNVEDLVIVTNEDVMMVMPKKDSQKVRSFVENLKKKDPDHPLV